MWMGTPGAVLPLALSYMRIFFAGTVFNLIYNIGSGLLRAVGDSRRPLYFLIVSCFTNITLDLVFVGVFGWGVSGVALATILSQAVSAVLVILTLTRSLDCYRLDLRQIRFHGPTLARIIRIGIPAGFSSSMYAISNTLIQATVNSFGTRTMAAWTAFTKLDGLYWMMLGAFGVTTATFCGQNFGAKKYGRMHRSVRAGLLMSLIVAVAISLFYQFTQDWALRLFLSDAETLRIALRILMIMTPFYFVFNPIEIFSGTCRSTGESLFPMLCSASGICGFRILWLLVVMPRFPNYEALSWSYPVSWAVTALIYSVYYFRKNWLTRHLSETEDAAQVLESYRSMDAG
jgi:putative MATE family efflux protein